MLMTGTPATGCSLMERALHHSDYCKRQGDGSGPGLSRCARPISLGLMAHPIPMSFLRPGRLTSPKRFNLDPDDW